MRERLELLEAKEKLRPFQKSLGEAVEHYLAYLMLQRNLEATLTMNQGLGQWRKYYESRNRSPRTIGEIRNMASVPWISMKRVTNSSMRFSSPCAARSRWMPLCK
jgi:hypothetical protein